MPDATPGATPRSLSRTVTVAAPPGEVFALLADPRRHPELDGSGSVRNAVGTASGGPARLSLGARFGMRMRYPGLLGVPYRITNRVVEFDEGRRIAWRHFGRHVWRWELEPVEVDGRRGTRVTETFDWGPSLAPRVLELAGFPARNAGGIDATLRRLAERYGTLPG